MGLTAISNWRLSLLVIALITAGCASTQPLDLAQISQGSTLSPVAITTSSYTIQTLQPEQFSGQRLRVYIEGDGRAWITSRTVSADPTPVTSFMPALAVSDQAVYMARPCQYRLGPHCDKSMWTHKRFSQQALSAMSEALDTLKDHYGNAEFELIGYSGGGTMALLLAGTRLDVSAVQTLAGNLDPDAWTTLKKLSPLTGSINPGVYAKRLQQIEQRHFVGNTDNVVPIEVARSYLHHVQPHCAELISVAASHHEGWRGIWPQYRQQPVRCR